jgi:hypothetical protein
VIVIVAVVDPAILTSVPEIFDVVSASKLTQALTPKTGAVPVCAPFNLGAVIDASTMFGGYSSGCCQSPTSLDGEIAAVGLTFRSVIVSFAIFHLLHQ